MISELFAVDILPGCVKRVLVIFAGGQMGLDREIFLFDHRTRTPDFVHHF
jgi:hypothetical protein